MGESLLISLIILIASLIQSTAGFGFALLAVPLLSLFMPMTDVVPTIVILSTVTNLFVSWEQRKSLKIREMLPLFIAGIAGIPLGVWGLKTFDQELLKALVGLIILVTSAALFFDWKISFSRKSLSLVTAGLFSGVLGGSLSMSGPPIILFLTNESYDKNSFRANLTLYGIITNLFALAAFAMGEILTTGAGRTAVIGSLPLLIGTAGGIVLSRKLGELSFKRGVLVLLALMGVITAVKGIGGLGGLEKPTCMYLKHIVYIYV